MGQELSSGARPGCPLRYRNLTFGGSVLHGGGNGRGRYASDDTCDPLPADGVRGCRTHTQVPPSRALAALRLTSDVGARGARPLEHLCCSLDPFVSPLRALLRSPWSPARSASPTTTSPSRLSVDGQPTSVHVFGSTVADVLDKQDIAVGPHDVVVPSLGSEVSDGDHISVRYGRKLTVTVDGQTKDYWTTATTVDSALQDLGIRADGAVLSASRSQTLGRSGLTLAVTTPKTVTVVVDGKTRTVTSTSPTVFGLLAELKVVKKVDDVVSPAMPTALDDGMKVVLKRVVVKNVRSTEAVGYSTTKQKDSSLYKGQTKVVTAGHKGTQGRHPQERPGRRQARQLDGRLAEVTKKPVTAVVKVGTKARPAAPVARPPSRSARQHLGRRPQPGQRRHVGPHRPVRVRRQLAHQHRQRLLRRPAVRDRRRGSPTVAPTSPRAPTSRRVPSRSPSPTATTPRRGLGPWGCAGSPPDAAI